jgi:HK97 family phage portal protein
MGLSTVYACVQRISSTIAQLHLDVMRRTENGVQISVGHTIQDLISVEPEQGFTAYDFWETYVANILIYGKAYAIIERLPNGDPYELRLVNPKSVKEKMVDGELMYEVKDRGVYMHADMLRVTNLYGQSPIELHREMLGLAKAAQDFAAEFFGSSGNMTGILSSNEPLKKEQIDIIKDSWNNSGDQLGTKLLPFGFRYDRIAVDPENASLTEQRDFLNQEICRIFGVPPSLVGVQSNVTYSNTEQQAIQFAKYTVVPWTRRLEQEMNCKLIAPDERLTHFTRFDLADLLRGDSVSRAQYYDTLVKGGIMSINEARRSEQLNDVPGGSAHMVQVNQITLDKLDEYSTKLSSNGN